MFKIPKIGKLEKEFSFILLILFFYLAPLFSFSFMNRLPTKTLSIKTASGNVVCVLAEIASTDKSREKGFMGRKNIPEGTGMLFVYNEDQIMRFWMKNTPSALSIAYIDSNGRIKDIFDMTPKSLADVTSTGYCRYALEVPKGWFKQNGITQGDFLLIDFLP